MSLTRQFLREFRPLFRMLEEPLGRPLPIGFTRRSALSPFSAFNNDPFFVTPGTQLPNVPAVDLSEEPGAYVVEAELPGVKKENVDLRIGDGGMSLTIEGRTFVQSSAQPRGEAKGSPTAEATAQASTEGTSADDTSKTVTQTTQQLTSERTFASSSSFSRTIWLPRRVDASNVSAKLEDGILKVRIPKAEDRESVKVSIE